MKITQIHDILNSVSQETFGESDLVNEDLSNLVDIGSKVFDANQVDNYVRKLVDKVGKVVFASKSYKSSVPSVVMDSWEFGAVVQKVRASLPKTEINDSWNLQNGQTYSQDVFYQPQVQNKFFSSRVTFDIPMSFTTYQVKSSFSNAGEMNAFLSMLQNSITNAMTVNLDNLVMRTITNMVGQVYHAGANLQKVNLIQKYKDYTGNTITSASAWTDSDFLKFATFYINLVSDRLTKYSTLFNAENTETFTVKEDQRLVLLSDFVESAKVNLLATTYNNDLVKLAESYDTVPYWQGTGSTYNIDKTSSIDVSVKTSDGNVEVKLANLVGVLFDKTALGVNCSNQRTTTTQNAKAEFYTNFTKYDANYFNDLAENFVIFYLEDVKA